jgi:hypothetical protein
LLVDIKIQTKKLACHIMDKYFSPLHNDRKSEGL